MRSRAKDLSGEDEVAETDTRQGRPPALRRVSEIAFIAIFFAVVVCAAIPMGANRDWAWSPIVVVLGALAVWQAPGLGIVDGHTVDSTGWAMRSRVKDLSDEVAVTDMR